MPRASRRPGRLIRWGVARCPPVSPQCSGPPCDSGQVRADCRRRHHARHAPTAFPARPWHGTGLAQANEARIESHRICASVVVRRIAPVIPRSRARWLPRRLRYIAAPCGFAPAAAGSHEGPRDHPLVPADALAAGGAEARRAFEAMMPMPKIDVATIKAARLR